MTIEDVTVESLELFNQSIKDDMRNKGMDASRKASSSLLIEKRGFLFVSTGISYIEYLDRGRPPGKFPPMAVIERWIDFKGLQVDPYIIARGISENGTRIFRNRELGLKLEDKTKVLQDDLNEKLPKFVSDQIKTAFNKALRGQ